MVDVKQRALLLVTLLIIFLVVFCLYNGIRHYSDDIENDIREQEHLIHTITQGIKKYSYRTYQFQIANFIEDNEQIRQAFADGKRERLKRLCAPLLKRYKEENPYFHAMDFNLPDGTVFLRVQKPELFGDNILETRTMLRSVHNKKKQTVGFDIGKHGAIYWVAEPVFYDGEYIGAVEFGIEAKQLERALETILENDVSFLLRGHDWQKAVLKKEGFQDLGAYVLMTHGDTLFDKIPSDVDLTVLHDQRLTLEKKEYILHNCFTLYDFKGEVVGRVLLLQDISKKIASKKAFVLQALIVGVFLILFSFIIIFYSFDLLIGRLERYARETRKTKEELQEAHDKLENRVEERTMELQGVNKLLQEEIHDRRQYQVKLEKHQDHLRAVTSEMLAVEDKQRRQIAVDLHDRIGQSLSAVKMYVDALTASTSENNTRVKLQAIADIVEQTVQDVRTLTFELSPPILYELGLGAALEWLADEFKQKYSLNITSRCEECSKCTSPAFLALIFRIIRELLVNVTRHAKAEGAEVEVRCMADGIRLLVRDNGCGMENETPKGDKYSNTGFGLFSIREQIISFGGTVEIHSQKDKGTEIVLTIPIKEVCSEPVIIGHDDKNCCC